MNDGEGGEEGEDVYVHEMSEKHTRTKGNESRSSTRMPRGEVKKRKTEANMLSSHSRLATYAGPLHQATSTSTISMRNHTAMMPSRMYEATQIEWPSRESERGLKMSLPGLRECHRYASMKAKEESWQKSENREHQLMKRSARVTFRLMSRG